MSNPADSCDGYAAILRGLIAGLKSKRDICGISVDAVQPFPAQPPDYEIRLEFSPYGRHAEGGGASVRLPCDYEPARLERESEHFARRFAPDDIII